MFMNIFKNDAFSLASMSGAIERIPTLQNHLGSLNLFTPNPIRNLIVGVEERDGKLSVIQTSKRGEPLKKRDTEKRKTRYFETSRIAKQDTILASELQFVRQFNTEDQIVELQAELARRLAGPTGLLSDVEYTWERMRLGAIQGKLLDADDSVIYNFYDEFGISEPSEIAFDLANGSPAAGVLRKKVQASVIRPMRKKAKGARYSGIRALCGSAFFDDLIAHVEVRDTYLNQQEASELRTGYDRKPFNFAGVIWEEFIGDDEDTDISVGVDKVRFIPEGVGNGVFEVVWSPGESFADVGELGQPVYPLVVPDTKRDQYVDLEVYSYPLFMCKRPDMLLRGKRQA